MRACMICLGGAAVFLLLLAAPNSISVRAAESTAAGEPPPISEYVSGDADCSGSVDAGDVTAILRLAVDIQSTCIKALGNVYCRDLVDGMDALAVLRHLLGLDDPLPDLCPPIGDSFVQPPSASLECDREDAVVDEAVVCSFSVAAFGLTAPNYSLAYSAASNVSESFRASSVACPPGGLPCIWAATGEDSLTFDHPGNRHLSLRACSYDACREVEFSIMVSPGN